MAVFRVQWNTTLKRDHTDEGPLWWETTRMKDHPHERPPWWETTLRIDHFDERPCRWQTTLVRYHPGDRSPWSETTLITPSQPERDREIVNTEILQYCHVWLTVTERPPSAETTLARDHPAERRDHTGARPPWSETTQVRGHPDERPSWWETTLVRDYPDEMRDHPDHIQSTRERQRDHWHRDTTVVSRLTDSHWETTQWRDYLGERPPPWGEQREREREREITNTEILQ